MDRRPVRRARRFEGPALEAGPVLLAGAPTPWLEREMANANQVERYNFPTTGTLREDPHPSTILRTRSEGCHRLGQLYDEMPEKDGDLAAFQLKRVDAVMSLPHDRIVPFDGSPAAVERAEFCRAWTKLYGKRLDTSLRHLIGKKNSHGTSFVELLWARQTHGPLAGAFVPVDLIVDRPMHRFFHRDGLLYVRRMVGQDPILAPRGKFLVLRNGTDRGWGQALSDNVYWPWFVKKHGMKFYCIFIEKWAQPTAIARYPSSRRALAGGESASSANSDLQSKALALARAFQSEFAMAVPEGLTLDLLEATRSGSADYNGFLSVCTRQESLVFLGEINTSGLRPGSGSYASDRVADDIRWEKVVLDAGDAMGVVHEQLFAPMVELNFGADGLVPTLQIETIAGADLEQRRKGVELLWSAGQGVTRRHLFQVAQAEEPQQGEEVVVGPTRTSAAPPAPPPADAAPGSTPPSPLAAAAPPVVATAPTSPVALAAGDESIDLAEELAAAEARDAALGEIADTFRVATVDYYQRHQDLVLQAWDEGRFEAGDALPWIVARIEAVRHAQNIETAQLHGIGLGLQHLQEDGISARFWRTGRTASVAPAVGAAGFAAGLLDLPLRQAATRHLLASVADSGTPATAIDHWAQLLNITKDAFLALEDGNRRFAFTVAGVTDASLLLDIQQLDERAAAEGWTRTTFRDELAGVYRRHGVAPTSDWHADLIYQNNVRQANAAVRYAQTVKNPAAARLTPYLGWATLGDDLVRARPLHNHRVMAERIFAIGHDIWSTWWYPAGHGCRCYVFTINRAKAQRMGLVGAEPTGPWPVVEGGRALPDPGFRGAPDLDSTADTLRFDSLAPLLDEAQRRGDNGLLDALRQLLLSLLGIDLRSLLGLSADERAVALLQGAA